MSFNKSKGLEKKNVFVFFLDEYYDKIGDELGNNIPNSLYVALTRSLQNLFIFRNSREKESRYLLKDKLS